MPVRPDDGATFAPTQVRQARSPRILATLAVVALGGLIAIGALDRMAASGDDSAGSVAAEPAASSIDTQPARSSRPPASATLGLGRRVESRPVAALLGLDVRPAGSHLFVHGDVFSLNVVVVVVSIEDDSGHVADVRSVELQGGSTAFRLGPNARFDALFDVPDELMGEGLWVHANAYDSRGRIIEAVHEPVIAPILDPA